MSNSLVQITAPFTAAQRTYRGACGCSTLHLFTALHWSQVQVRSFLPGTGSTTNHELGLAQSGHTGHHQQQHLRSAWLGREASSSCSPFQGHCHCTARKTPQCPSGQQTVTALKQGTRNLPAFPFETELQWSWLAAENK